LKKIYTLLSFFFLLLFSNCATVIHGSRQKMIITCEPRIADVFLDGTRVGQTPLTVKLARAHNHKIRICLEGYAPYEVNIKRRLDGWIFGNILIGGVIGIGVDALSGSMFRLSPAEIYPELKVDAATGFRSAGDNISIVLLSKPDPGGVKIGQLQCSPVAD
jgi:hypothetical protein